MMYHHGHPQPRRLVPLSSPMRPLDPYMHPYAPPVQQVGYQQMPVVVQGFQPQVAYSYPQQVPAAPYYPVHGQVQSGEILPNLTDAIADVSTSADRNAAVISRQLESTGMLVTAGLVALTLGIIGAVLLTRSKPPVVVVVGDDKHR